MNNLEQGRLNAMPLPRPVVAAHQLDYRALRGGLEGLPQEFGRHVRRRQDMPKQVRPVLDGLPLIKQIAVIVEAHQVFCGRERTAASEDANALRCIRVARIYDELQRIGVKFTTVDGFRERHARLLLARWREQKRSVATIRTQWSVIRTWTLALGKGGLVSRLEAYWPDAPKTYAPKAGSTADPGQLGRKHDDPEVMARLLRQRDQTHFYVERLAQALGLTVEESLLFSSAMAGDYVAGRLIVQARVHQQPKQVPLGGHEHVLLVQDVQDFLARTGRACVLWPDMSLAQGVRKHENHMAYQRRQIRKTASVAPRGEGTAGGAGGAQ